MRDVVWTGEGHGWRVNDHREGRAAPTSSANGMRRRVAEFDWSVTPIGARRTWPATLSALVEVMLASNFPTFIVWGQAQTMIYNDAYTPILADKHPAALGRPFLEVWPEARGQGDSVFGRALRGEASFFLNRPTVIERRGRREPAFFTFSYSPVRESEDGPVLGAICICHETTEAVEAQRHAHLLVELDSRLRPLRDPEAIIVAAQETLGEALEVNRVGYGRIGPDERYFTTTNNWTDGSVESHEGIHDLAAFGPAVLAAMRGGETLVIDDAQQFANASLSDAATAFEAIEAMAVVVVSLVKDGALTAALYAHQKAPRAWTPAEVRLIEAVAERIWSAVERVGAEAALRHSEARFREFFEAAGDAIFVEDEQGRYVEVNAAACRLLGYERHELIGMKVRDVVATHDAPRIQAWRATGGQGHPSVAAWRLRRKDGTWVDVEISAQILASGGVEAVVRDVSQQRAEQARRTLMLNELNHRVKNSLATVQAIAAQTFRGKADVEARNAFTERLMALARANDILVAEAWRGADLRRIAADVASPFAARGDRFTVSGPSLLLPPQAATALALALHELATNAAKYGALSSTEGRVTLEWTLIGAGDDAEFELVWREAGGPRVSPPAQTGFGTRLVHHGLKTELGGEVRVEYRPSGLVCVVRAPVPRGDGRMLDLQAYSSG